MLRASCRRECARRHRVPQQGRDGRPSDASHRVSASERSVRTSASSERRNGKTASTLCGVADTGEAGEHGLAHARARFRARAPRQGPPRPPGSSAAARAAAQRSSSVPRRERQRALPRNRERVQRCCGGPGGLTNERHGSAPFLANALQSCERAHPIGAARPAPARRAFPRRRRSPPPLQWSCRRLPQLRHRLGAVVAHARHQHADQLLRRHMLHRGRHEPVGARMPGIVGLAGALIATSPRAALGTMISASPRPM